MADNYYPDFDFPYDEGTPTTKAITNSPIDVRLGQVPDIEDEKTYASLLEVYNAIQILQNALGNLTAATGNGLTKSRTITSVTSNYTVLVTDGTVLVNAVGGDRTITLPPVAGIEGYKFIVKRVDSTEANDVTITGDGSEPIDGGDVNVLPDEAYTLQATDSGWAVVSNAVDITQIQADLTELIDVTIVAMQVEIDANTSGVSTNAGNIDTNTSNISTINTEIDVIDLVLIDFEARISALENP